MKIVLFPALITITFFSLLFSCKKKEIENIDMISCDTTSIIAQEETDTCAVKCDSCNQIYAPCTIIEKDEFIYASPTISSEPVIVKTVDSTSFYFRVDDQGFIRFTFDHQPNLTTNYVGDSTASNQFVKVEFRQKVWAPLCTGHGNIFINCENDQYHISACNLNMLHIFTGDTINQVSFNLLIE